MGITSVHRLTDNTNIDISYIYKLIQFAFNSIPLYEINECRSNNKFKGNPC